MTIQEAIKHVEDNKKVNRSTYIIPRNSQEPFRKDELMTIESINENQISMRRHADGFSYSINAELIIHFKII